MEKITLVAYNGELMCFSHVLLYALDFHEKGYDTGLIIEGASLKLLPDLCESGKLFSDLFAKVRDAGLIKEVCRACSAKLGILELAQKEELPISGSLKGHPSLEPYLAAGKVLTF